MCHGTPRFVFGKIQHDEVLIVARQEKSWRCDLPVGHSLSVLPFVLERDDGQGHRHIQAVLHQQLAKYSPHLLEPQRHFASALIAGICDDDKVLGVDLGPRRLGCIARSAEEQEKPANQKWVQSREHERSAQPFELLMNADHGVCRPTPDCGISKCYHALEAVGTGLCSARRRVHRTSMVNSEAGVIRL